MRESTNPTVPLYITRKELLVLSEAIPYGSPYGELRQKILNASLAMDVAHRDKNRERKAARKAKVGEHRANGPYLPVGDLGGERCVECHESWPCAEAECQSCKWPARMGHYADCPYRTDFS